MEMYRNTIFMPSKTTKHAKPHSFAFIRDLVSERQSLTVELLCVEVEKVSVFSIQSTTYAIRSFVLSWLDVECVFTVKHSVFNIQRTLPAAEKICIGSEKVLNFRLKFRRRFHLPHLGPRCTDTNSCKWSVPIDRIWFSQFIRTHFYGEKKNGRQLGCHGNADGRHKIKCHVHFDRARDVLNQEFSIIQIECFFGHNQFSMHTSMFGEGVISEIQVQ